MEDGTVTGDPKLTIPRSTNLYRLSGVLSSTKKATGDRDYLKPIEKASEFFLQHHLFRSDHTGEIIHPSMVELHYPLYWHCDILQELTILSRAGKLDDPRTKEAPGYCREEEESRRTMARRRLLLENE